MTTRPFSRDMPTRDQVEFAEATLGWRMAGYILLAAFIGGLLFIAIVKPLLFGLAALAYTIFGIVADHRHERWLRQLIEDRRSDSICTFARSFDRKTVDPWVIRAVWEEVQEFIGHTRNGEALPLRADDLFTDIFHYYDWDLEDIWWTPSRRVGKDVEELEQNPYFGKVDTVGDFVLFLNAQPPASPPTAPHFTSK